MFRSFKRPQGQPAGPNPSLGAQPLASARYATHRGRCSGRLRVAGQRLGGSLASRGHWHAGRAGRSLTPRQPRRGVARLDGRRDARPQARAGARRKLSAFFRRNDRDRRHDGRRGGTPHMDAGSCSGSLRRHRRGRSSDVAAHARQLAPGISRRSCSQWPCSSALAGDDDHRRRRCGARHRAGRRGSGRRCARSVSSPVLLCS